VTKEQSQPSISHDRREFVGSSALALALALTGCSSEKSGKEPPANTESESQAPLTELSFGNTYSRDETRHLLSQGTRGLNVPARVGLPFWWDKQAKMLINPTNVTFDPSVKAGDYQLQASILNFRASQKELGDVWNKLTNNAQLNINPGSVSTEGDPLQWIVMTGINVAQDLFSNKDNQLAPLTQNNKPTDSLRPAETVTFKKGLCTIGITLCAQKKKSVWDKLLSAVKAFTGSSVFGMLPIPKLYQTAIQSVTASLNQLQSQSSLITVLGGKSYGYKLYDGSNSDADLTFRSGHWVVLDSEFAASHMDSKSNLSGVYLDIPGLLYQLKGSNNQVVDTTYTVAELSLSPATTASGS
jgi:hypothetical protein